MSSVAIRGNEIVRRETPYYPFPENPELVMVDGYPAYRYLDGETTSKIFDDLIDQVDHRKFDTVVINMNGGAYLAEKFLKRTGFKGEIVLIGYHRTYDENGGGVRKDGPLPQEILDGNVLVVDDVHDDGKTLKELLGDFKEDNQPTALIAFKKRGVQNQIQFGSNVIYGAEVDDKWLAGCGMNMDRTDDPIYPPNCMRGSNSLLVRIDAA